MAERDGLQYLGKRQDGRHTWRVRPYVGQPRRRVSATFDTPTDSIKAARKQATKVVEELARNANLTDTRRPTVAALLDEWLGRKSKVRSPRTIHDYRRRADRIAAKLGKIRVDKLTADTIDAWYHEMREAGVTESEVLELHKVLSAALRWRAKLMQSTFVPTSFVERPKHKSAEVEPPSVELVRRLMLGLPDAEWARAIALLVFTGMRRGEVCGLRWEDLDGRRITVRHSILEIPGEDRPVVQPFPKNREVRVVALSAAALEVLELQRRYIMEVRGRESLPAWVFPDWNSWRLRDPRRPSSVSRAWNRYRAPRGGKSVRPHDLRHFFATEARKGGQSFHDIARQLGHRNVTTTIKIYTHATEGGTDAVVDSVASTLGFLPS